MHHNNKHIPTFSVCTNPLTLSSEAITNKLHNRSKTWAGNRWITQPLICQKTHKNTRKQFSLWHMYRQIQHHINLSTCLCWLSRNKIFSTIISIEGSWTNIASKFYFLLKTLFTGHIDDKSFEAITWSTADNKNRQKKTNKINAETKITLTNYLHIQIQANYTKQKNLVQALFKSSDQDREWAIGPILHLLGPQQCNSHSDIDKQKIKSQNKTKCRCFFK